VLYVKLLAAVVVEEDLLLAVELANVDMHFYCSHAC
jgi:hypothetical protein